MTYLTFATTLVVNSLLLATLIQSWKWPAQRIWPPPRRASWQFIWTWTLIVLLCLGLFALAVLDWDTFVFAHWLRFVLAGLFIVLGNAVAWWGVAVLSLSTTAGLKGQIVTHGPYRFSRNPQYLGDIAILIGVGFLANSLLVWLVVAPAVILCIVAPFAEELWLTEQYGEEYERYRHKVRRFL